ncbi:MAG: hypothetical protein A3B86_01465 [Candidatus Yanofskybacteria bacterium RIFCSPHIGHO2_02_FULL_38_22b]|uniref:Uncharacterized protein n=1 Tax=Candidatus Yanofskybacteria bacterium RIFCSPHIGHO2_02_FULL_38_22b TaxID=1802673 RepID=A0A1F8F5B5_9BACT|nr:MAG: hypothetical protein A3B86_01465 [Candidatus Yanofskybacteria bacterium RIFCSPHIGHO2_02_FULL_38_22b]OGN20489.1 MAG: hypothetical protein A2910_02325 [Candidatus Yanofskybacteria bacterium RIFCSPLOWO2_01_FULL_39_28]
MHIIEESITREELKKIAIESFGYLVKGVVDIEKGIMSLGGELHYDNAMDLVQKVQSKNENLWGINLYPDKSGEAMIEFDSMVNVKPNLGNRTRSVDNPDIRDKIKKIVQKLILE